MRRIAVAAIVTLLAVCAAPAPASALVFRSALNKMTADQSFTLRCVSARAGVPLPIPERWEVDSAHLVYTYTNSLNLRPKSSEIVFLVNEIPVSQQPLDPENPDGRVLVTLPASLLKAGYNNLEFHAIQHYVAECENPCAPDLWTTIDLSKAYVEITYHLKPTPLALSEMSSFLFDPKTPDAAVNVITPNQSDETLRVAGIVASGVSARFDYRRVDFTMTPVILPGVDNVLIGDVAFVRATLAAYGATIDEDIRGPFVKLYHLPRPLPHDKKEGPTDPTRALLVVTGAMPSHVAVAAETVASMTFEYPGTAQMTVLDFTLPRIDLYTGKLMLTAGKTHKFRTLAFPTHTFKGLQPNPRELAFRLPPDFFIRENEYAKLVLNFAYSPGLRNDSVLSILLNGTYVRALNLSSDMGDTINGYVVEIPTSLFKPGGNVLRFAPIMTPEVHQCELLQLEGIFLTIFDNSTLLFPPMAHFVEMPNLELFMVNGFPFTRWPDGHETLVYLADDDPAMGEAALNMIGLMTQKNGYPLLGLRFTHTDTPTWKGDALVLGTLASLPDSLRLKTPLVMGGESLVPYPTDKNHENDSDAFVKSRQISGLGANRAAVTQFQAPGTEGRSVVLVTADSVANIREVAHHLLDPGVQGAIKGDIAILKLDETPPRISAMLAGESYYTGKEGKLSEIEFFLHSHPKMYYLAVGLMGLLITLLAIGQLVRMRNRRLALSGPGEKPQTTFGAFWSFIKHLFIQPKATNRNDEDD